MPGISADAATRENDETPFKPCEVVGADIFMINNKMLLCIVDYHSRFPVVKKGDNHAVDDLVQMTTMIFAEYGLPKKIISDTSTT